MKRAELARVVLDTSVFIAAFYQPLDRPCFSRDVFNFMAENAEVYISDYILDEFREKCGDKLDMSVTQIKALLAIVLQKAKLVPSPAGIAGPKHLRDKNDLPILALAVSVRADYLVTWDKDLLTLGQFRGTVILSPRSFWDYVSGNRPRP